MKMHDPVTLALPWRCLTCGAAGELAHAAENDCLQKATGIEEAHAIASPQCERLDLVLG